MKTHFYSHIRLVCRTCFSGVSNKICDMPSVVPIAPYEIFSCHCTRTTTWKISPANRKKILSNSRIEHTYTYREYTHSDGLHTHPHTYTNIHIKIQRFLLFISISAQERDGHMRTVIDMLCTIEKDGDNIVLTSRKKKKMYEAN